MNQSQLTCGHVLLGGGHHDQRGVHGARGVHVQLESVIVLHVLDCKRMSNKATEFVDLLNLLVELFFRKTPWY